MSALYAMGRAATKPQRAGQRAKKRWVKVAMRTLFPRVLWTQIGNFSIIILCLAAYDTMAARLLQRVSAEANNGSIAHLYQP